jgi:hypothetical protein
MDLSVIVNGNKKLGMGKAPLYFPFGVKLEAYLYECLWMDKDSVDVKKPIVAGVLKGIYGHLKTSNGHMIGGVDRIRRRDNHFLRKGFQTFCTRKTPQPIKC